MNVNNVDGVLGEVMNNTNAAVCTYVTREGSEGALNLQ